MSLIRRRAATTALLALAAAGLAACAPPATTRTLVDVPTQFRQAPFDEARTLQAPKGTRIGVVARIPGARFMAYLPDQSVLVSQPGGGAIKRISPVGVVSTWADGLRSPHDLVVATISGVTWVYVAESHRISRVRWDASAPNAAGPLATLVDNLPDASTPELMGAYAHGLKNIAVGGGRLYISIASSCNACTEDTRSSPIRGAVYIAYADGTGLRRYHRGLRNAEGLAFGPDGKLWAAVNNRDNIAYPFDRDITGDGVSDFGRVLAPYVDDNPPEELTPLRDGGDTGWPYCNPDPTTAAGYRSMPFAPDAILNPRNSVTNCATRDKVAVGLQAHSAPLGLSSFAGTNVPAPWKSGMAVAYHGSWNRTVRTGYKVAWLAWDTAKNAPGVLQDLLTGFVESDGDLWGRPVDVIPAPDGSLLVSDDFSGTVYRVTLPKPAA